MAGSRFMATADIRGFAERGPKNHRCCPWITIESTRLMAGDTHVVA
jgi:hypothetical protein